MFREGVHSAHDTPEHLPDWLEHGARLVMSERPPWGGDHDLEAIAAAPFPKLVISGGTCPRSRSCAMSWRSGLGPVAR